MKGATQPPSVAVVNCEKCGTKRHIFSGNIARQRSYIATRHSGHKYSMSIVNGAEAERITREETKRW